MDIAAHCDCMAGLGETCSQWVIACGIQKRESLTVTQRSAYWVMPPGIRSVEYAPTNLLAKKRSVQLNPFLPPVAREEN